MVDLKNPKWEDFRSIEAHSRELKPGEKVRCTFRRAVPGTDMPKTEPYHITKLPKELYDEFFQKRV